MTDSQSTYSTDSWEDTSFKLPDLKKLYPSKTDIATIFEPAFYSPKNTVDGITLILQKKKHLSNDNDHKTGPFLNLKIIQTQSKRTATSIITGIENSDTCFISNNKDTNLRSNPNNASENQTSLFEVQEKDFEKFLTILSNFEKINNSRELASFNVKFKTIETQKCIYEYIIEGSYLYANVFEPGKKYSFAGLRVKCYETIKRSPDFNSLKPSTPISDIQIRKDQFKYIRVLLNHHRNFGTFRTLLIGRSKSECPLLGATNISFTTGSCAEKLKAYFQYADTKDNKEIISFIKTILIIGDIASPTVMPIIYNNEPENLFFKGKMREAKNNSKNKVLDLWFNNKKFYVNQVSLSDFVRFLEGFESFMEVKPQFDAPSKEQFELIRQLFLAKDGVCPLE